MNCRALCDVVESLTKDNIRAYEEELLGIDVNLAEKDMVLSKCASSQESWSVKKPKLTIHCISSNDDVPILEPNEAVPALGRHLQGAQCRHPKRQGRDDACFCSTGASRSRLEHWIG